MRGHPLRKTACDSSRSPDGSEPWFVDRQPGPYYELIDYCTEHGEAGSDDAEEGRC